KLICHLWSNDFVKARIAVLLFICLHLNGQEEIMEIVKEGVELHDKGMYKEAIATYQKALDIDKRSPLVNYEIGYSFFASGEYKKAIKYMNIVIKQDKNHLRDAYITKGSCLDMLKKTKAAITTYEKGIALFPDDYLLQYNLGLTFFNHNQRAAAEKHILRAIENNPIHPTSNYLLAAMCADKGQRVEAILPLYFFLLLEPTSNRSKDALNLLLKLLHQGVVKKDAQNIEITINHLGFDNEFSNIDMFISLLGANVITNEEMTEEEHFVDLTESIFSICQEQRKEQKGLYWELYIDFYIQLLETENIEAFCYYITQSKGENVNNWIEENEQKYNKFISWLTEQ
ncbi:MAG: tetratricopeptide repeat protein, partial [Chitinophagales bacterium]